MKSCLVILFFLLAPTAHAGPKHWVKTHKRFLLMEGTAITAASIHAAGLHHCRKVNGVEPCDEHYGEAWAGFGIATGFNTILWPALAEHCWSNGDNKLCYAIGYTGSAVQLGRGIYEWQLYKPEKELTIQRVMSLDYKRPSVGD